MLSRARFSANAPYNALPPLPPRAELETRTVMKALVGARASSAIENIVTTADRLFRFVQDDESAQAAPATKEAPSIDPR